MTSDDYFHSARIMLDDDVALGSFDLSRHQALEVRDPLLHRMRDRHQKFSDAVIYKNVGNAEKQVSGGEMAWRSARSVGLK